MKNTFLQRVRKTFDIHYNEMNVLLSMISFYNIRILKVDLKQISVCLLITVNNK